MQHPHSFRPVRDLGVVPVSCPVKSEEPGCSSFVWLPAWLPSWLEWRTSKCRSSLGYEPSAWHVPTCSEPFSPSIRAAPGLWSFESANLDSASPSVVARSAGARRLLRGLAGWPARSRNHGKLPGRRPIRAAGAVHRVAEPQLPLPMAKLRVAVRRPMRNASGTQPEGDRR